MKILENYFFHSPKLFFYVTGFAGMLILSDYLNYQLWLSQGDHGLNLYASEAVFRGERPYRDFEWFYGPLMLYYHSFLFKLLGVKITSVLFGEVVLKLLCGLLIYQALSLYLAPFLSFTGALWYWAFAQDLLFTYNHTGGIALSVAMVYVTLLYTKKRENKYIYAGFLFAFLLSMIKLNPGISALAALISAVIATDRFYNNSLVKKRVLFLVLSFLAFLVFACLANWALVYDLPFYVIKQCYQYFGSNTAIFRSTDILANISYKLVLIFQNIFSGPLNLILAALFTVCAVYNFYLFVRKKMNQQHTLAFLTLIVFYCFQIHEFLMCGVESRVRWADPFKIMLIFMAAGLTVQRFSKPIQFLFTLTLCGLTTINLLDTFLLNRRDKVPSHYIGLDKARIFASNSSSWISTVTQTIHFLKSHLKSDELFLALPYDPLYYFLADKTSPTRKLVFFDFSFIPHEQEMGIIQELENKKVNWIVMSNRIVSNQDGQGIFGKTNSVFLGKYIEENFQVVAEFGEWERSADWVENHGTRILRRKIPITYEGSIPAGERRYRK